MSEPTSGPLSWRDVYTAVGESERRVVDAIDQLRDDLGKVGDDHEGRLRAVESLTLPLSERNHLIERLVDVEAAVASFKSRETGIFGTLGVLRTAALFAIAISGLALAIINAARIT